MHCPKCNFEQINTNTECAKCGLIFAKYNPIQDDSNRSSLGKKISAPEKLSIRAAVKKLLFTIESDVNELSLIARIVLFVLFFFWGWKFILSSIESNYAGTSFLHLINLPFHEAGHMIFMPFGKFIQTLGGTIGQLMIPAICLIVFLVKTRDPFGGSVALWWLGENFMDIAPYINDARALKLRLLGGVTGRETVDYHDWEYILRQMGWLKWDHILASISQSIGIAMMIASFAWGGYILYLQYQKVKNTR